MPGLSFAYFLSSIIVFTEVSRNSKL